MKPIWVLVNCNSIEEAKKIGGAILDKRLASCFDIFPRELATYFWPPKSGQKETAKGALLILETFDNQYRRLQPAVKALHSDELPFIGYIETQGTEQAYQTWIEDELKEA